MTSSNTLDGKIKTLNELREIVQNFKVQGKVVVHCHGVFDLLHPGHIRHFEAAKRQGDVLIVTLTKDEYVGKGPARPVFNQHLRAESLAALQSVDYVAINEWPTAVEAIRLLLPDVYVKGNEYVARDSDLTGKIYDEERAITEVGGRLYFTDDITFSSTKILNSYFGVLPHGAEVFLEEFRRRYTSTQVIEMLKNFRGIRVLVVGDTIIDQYHFCEVLGKSQKSHNINARFLHEESYAGGVLAVANHVAGFCDNVHLVTCLGEKDSWHDFIVNHLKPNISSKFFFRVDAPTILKRRFTETHLYTKMFEETFLDDCPLPPDCVQGVVTYLERILPDYDLVLVADFGHGFVEPGIIDILTRNSRYLAANVQTNSANTGYNVITKFPRADYICIDEPELRLANRDKFGHLPNLIEHTALQLGASMVAVTQGNHGSTTYQQGKAMVHVPVFSTKVVDTLGAGDAYLAITAPCALGGYPAELLGFVGNCVGALKVLSVGNKESVEPIPLFRFIATLLK